MKELTLEAVIENIPLATSFVDEQLEELGCPIKAQMQIDVAIGQVFMKNGHLFEALLEVEEEPLSVVITFIDHGVPYDPLKKADPDVTLSADQREIGGLGIFLVKKTMDEVSYDYKDGQNILTIRKKL